MNKKLWGGRFSATAEHSLEEFWNSIGFDYRLLKEDIQGSLAHVEMLAKSGIISTEEAQQITTGLHQVAQDFESGREKFSASDEDIHMNVERLLHKHIGAVAGKLHTARSRNDQVALDMHLFVRTTCLETVGLLTNLQLALCLQAENNISLIIPGYTHLQRAQPVLISHHLLAYAWMLQRDISRAIDCAKRTNISPLGAGALAGTTFPIDPEHTAKILGFNGIYQNSMDAVSDRDFVIEMLSVNALIAAHLSRLCEEIVIWSTAEFGFITLSDSYSTGSSMMPQKKNPDLAELVRGKTGRVYGALIAMLTVIKGTPLTYNKDFQEDKESLFDSVDTIQNSLKHLSGMISSMRINPARAKEAVNKGFLNATDLADYLAKKGLPFRKAHEIVGQLTASCLEKNKELLDLTLEELKAFAPKIESDIFSALQFETIVTRRNSPGGTAPNQVQIQLTKLRQLIQENQMWSAHKDAK